MLKKPPKKIENWFKHKRRQDANKGKMKFEVIRFYFFYSLLEIKKKRKKVFSQSEKEAMMKEFLANPLPSDDKFKEMLVIFCKKKFENFRLIGLNLSNAKSEI